MNGKRERNWKLQNKSLLQYQSVAAYKLPLAVRFNHRLVGLTVIVTVTENGNVTHVIEENANTEEQGKSEERTVILGRDVTAVGTW